jgi:hypothetical protein
VNPVATFAIRTVSVVGALLLAVMVPVTVAFIASLGKGVGSAAAVGLLAWMAAAAATVRAVWLSVQE